MRGVFIKKSQGCKGLRSMGNTPYITHIIIMATPIFEDQPWGGEGIIIYNISSIFNLYLFPKTLHIMNTPPGLVFNNILILRIF